MPPAIGTKPGKSLVELAQELERRSHVTKDYIAPQGKILAVVDNKTVVLDGLNGGGKPLTNYAHRQMADLLKIPANYYDRMAAEQPDLLAHNINTWLHDKPAEMRMLRTLDGRVRAVLSNKYRALDNFDLATVVLPELQAMNAQIISSELTETRMYIKAILPELSDTLPESLAWGVGHNHVGGALNRRVYGGGGKVVSAIVISNSEVGAGTLRIEPSVFTVWCTNLAIMMEAAMKKYHVGRASSADEDFSVYTDATRQADDTAFWMKVRDVARKAFDKDAFQAAVNRIKEAAGEPIVSPDLPKVVEIAVKRLSLPESLGGGILTALAHAGDLSKWGLSSAITELAASVDDYEKATELEKAGGKVLALPPADWTAIANAA